MENNSRDILLVRQAREGDTIAFRTLVEKYKDMSFSLARSILKDPDRAEDVLQDAFIKVYHGLAKFRHDSSFATWLYRIVINACLNEKAIDKSHLFVETTNVSDEEPSENFALSSLQSDERKKFIEEAFAHIKTEEALVLRLHYLCELSILEVREVTDLSESNIKVLLHRGRKNLHAQLQRLVGIELRNLL